MRQAGLSAGRDDEKAGRPKLGSQKTYQRRTCSALRGAETAIAWNHWEPVLSRRIGVRSWFSEAAVSGRRSKCASEVWARTVQETSR